MAKLSAYRARVVFGAVLLAAFSGCTGSLVFRPEAKPQPSLVAPAESQTKNGQPDQKSAATRAAIESGKAGIREDVYIWIYTNYSSTKKRTVLTAMARTAQEMLSHPPVTAEAAQTARLAFEHALAPLRELPGLTPKQAKEMDDELFMEIFDTPASMKVYLQYDLLLAGKKGAS